MQAEPAVQPRFSFVTPILCAVAAMAVLFAHWQFMALPDREPMGPRAAALRLSPNGLDPAGFRPFRLVGAWSVESDDPRFGGVSGLAVDGPDLVAITDWGVVIRFPKPGGARLEALVHELGDAPGPAEFKKNRDSEALARDPFGRGWWVAFEHSNQLWLYDPRFQRALRKEPIPTAETRHNRGVEGVAAVGEELILLPETGGRLLRTRGGKWSEERLGGPQRRGSDLAALPSGSLLMVQREPRLPGFDNMLVKLDPCTAGYCLAWRKRLPLGRRDNVEALAVEPLPSGRIRLWLMTDNNNQRRISTLLVVLDLPPQD